MNFGFEHKEQNFSHLSKRNIDSTCCTLNLPFWDDGEICEYQRMQRKRLVSTSVNSWLDSILSFLINDSDKSQWGKKKNKTTQVIN